MGYSETNVQRKKKIEDCLLSLMQEIPYEEITVKGLAEKLQIARKTFYHYFPNKQSCLKSLTERLLFECHLRQLQADASGDLEVLFRIQLQFWLEHKDYLDVINRNRLESFLLNRIMAFVSWEENDLPEKLSTPDVPFDEDILLFFVSGQVFLLLKWARESFRKPVEEMVKKSVRLVREPLICKKE